MKSGPDLDESQNPAPTRLSICITTFNRAHFIGATLESILPQLESNCEVVIVDGASSDNTEEVVGKYARNFERLRYYRQATNEGIDRDYDRTVLLATGEYCWLMTDDDLLNAGAIAKVLSALDNNPSLLLVNYQRFDVTLSKLVLSRSLDVYENATYGPEDMDSLFSETGPLLLYIGAVVIRRSVWLARDRKRYYDTMLMHVGVIFQRKLPGASVVIAEPLVRYRDGNLKTFWPQMFEICLIKFPDAALSFAITQHKINRYLFGDPRNPTTLLFYRAMGWYSFTGYRRWLAPRLPSARQRGVAALVALTPGLLANFFWIMKAVAHTRNRELTMLHLRMSPFYYRNYKVIGHTWN